MSQETKKPKVKHHAYGIPNPKLPPRNISPSIQGDQRCSAPSCHDYATKKCNFCELHCRKFHRGIHYRNMNIPIGKNIKKETLAWRDKRRLI